MNQRSLYLEIGNIDDDLIQEASEARGHGAHRPSFARLAGLAACLCLLCTAILFGMRGDVIYYNEAPAPLTLKVLVPSDENTTVLTLTYQELFQYYGLEPLPDMLSGMRRSEQPHYYVYQTPDNTVYDTNVLYYRSHDGGQTLSIVLETHGSDDAPQAENMRGSRIDGVSLVLAVSDRSAEGLAQPVYWAELAGRGISFCIVSSGMDESSFTDIIRAIIQIQK